MAESKKPRPILINDDGWILGEAKPPLTVRDLKDRIVDTYRGSPIGALFWSVGNSAVCMHETEVGEVFGEGYENLDDPSDRRRAANIRHLIEECGGPLTAMVDLCHQARIDIFPSVRMNSHYQIDPAAPSFGRIRREHPGLLIGRPGEEIPERTLEWGIRTGLDYAHPEVREHVSSVIEELFERFDVDGVELDFMRHPAFFRTEEAYANRYLMTDLLRRVRRRMEEISVSKDRRLELAVRVPPTLADSARIGVDVAQWMAEGLVDIVVAGGGFIPFETPIEEFLAAAQGGGCRVYGCIESARPAVDDGVIRAIAGHFWNAGASGIYLFNFFGKSPEWKQRLLGEIGDSAALRRLDKRFHMDHNTRLTIVNQHDYPFRYAIPAVQLPVTLPDTLSGRGPALRLRVADDVESASAEGALARCVLRLGFESFRAEDEIEVWLNGEVLSSGSRRASYGPWSRLEWTGYPTRWAEVEHSGGSLELDVGCPPLRQGDNELEVRLVGPAFKQSDTLVLADVEVVVEYRPE